jgi:hypothetical protein
VKRKYDDLKNFSSTLHKVGWNQQEVLKLTRERNLNTPNTLPDLVITRIVPSTSYGSYPKPLTKYAFHGLAGEFVKKVGPHTEADDAALLSHLLTYYGNIIGRGSYWQIEDSKHYLNLFMALVGKTGVARKGTAERRVRNVFDLICRGQAVPLTPGAQNPWTTRRQTGLSSGEGLIWAVRDFLGGDPGEKDKRLLVVEEEFAGALKAMKRHGNTLSPVIRQAWDDGHLGIMTKNLPAKATGSHISIIGHITEHELVSHLESTEMANGLANRFLFFCVKRSKKLPHGAKLPKKDIGPIMYKLKRAISFGRSEGEIRLDSGAIKLWEVLYDELSDERPGLVGAIVSRAAPQVRRLAAIYACLARSKVVRQEHLLAGLAVWDYCEQSVYHIFGNRTGDQVADRIMGALSKSNKGLTRTEINSLFSRNESANRIQIALDLLESRNLVSKRQDPTTGGRPAERWVSL